MDPNIREKLTTISAWWLKKAVQVLKLKEVKRIAASLNVRPTKATDAFYDSLVKMACLMLDEPSLASSLLADAMDHVKSCRQRGQDPKLRAQRQLKAMSDEEVDFEERRLSGRMDRGEIGHRRMSSRGVS